MPFFKRDWKRAHLPDEASDGRCGYSRRKYPSLLGRFAIGRSVEHTAAEAVVCQVDKAEQLCTSRHLRSRQKDRTVKRQSLGERHRWKNSRSDALLGRHSICCFVPYSGCSFFFCNCRCTLSSLNLQDSLFFFLKNCYTVESRYYSGGSPLCMKNISNPSYAFCLRFGFV